MLKIVVAVIVYNRYENVRRWINCWKQSNTIGAGLVIIHNDNGEWVRFRDLCHSEGVKYVLRPNRGFDIGAMQDVFMERLIGFPPNWNYLLWCTDDVIPMAKDFIDPFLTNIKMASIAAMHISPEYESHVRTGCFMIAKGTSKLIKFPADPVLTKKQCYDFEHRGGLNTMTNQIRLMGGDCVQVAPLSKSPMYDLNYWKRNRKAIIHFNLQNREPEHNEVFRKSKTVS